MSENNLARVINWRVAIVVCVCGTVLGATAMVVASRYGCDVTRKTNPDGTSEFQWRCDHGQE